MTLNKFVEEWNAAHKKLIFSVYDSSGVNRPTSVEIRYTAVSFRSLYSTENWYRLIDMVDAKSHGTMVVVTSEELFERGIIEIKIASCNHNYSDRFAVGTLCWIGEEFFEEAKLLISGERRQDE